MKGEEMVKDYKTAYIELVKEIKREKKVHKQQESIAKKKGWYTVAISNKEAGSTLDALLVYIKQEKWKF